MDSIEREIEEIIKGAIIRTVAFFDLFDYPLALAEIYKYLYLPERERGHNWIIKFLLSEIKISNIEKALESLVIGGRLETKNGFYYLAGREGLVLERQRRFNYFNRKIKRAKKIAKIFSCLPWIRMVAIGNIIGAHNLKEESDIDILIIAEKGRIWSVRFFTNLVTMALGLRPKKGRTRDKICLSFYLATDHLELNSTRLEEDIYLAYWLSGLACVFDRTKTFNKFVRSNIWVSEILPNWKPAQPNTRRRVELSFFSLTVSLIILAFSFWLEPVIRRVQLKVFPEEIKDKSASEKGVVYTNSIIKLHVKDRREWYREEWKKRIILS